MAQPPQFTTARDSAIVTAFDGPSQARRDIAAARSRFMYEVPVPHRPLEDWEDPDPDDDDDGDDNETSPCPACGEQIYEDADRCPYCGEAVVLGGGSPLAGRPWWYVVLALLGIIATLFTILNWRG